MAKYTDSLRGYTHEVLKRDGFVCRYCGLDGKTWPYWLYFSGDHLLPEGDPRRDDPDFVVAACRFCNEVHNKTPRDVEGKTRDQLVEQKKPDVMARREEYKRFWEEHVKPVKDDWGAAVEAVRAYGSSRRAFRAAQEKLGLLLAGNDNKVGVCGEFWAKWYYHQHGYQITEVPRSNNEGYDFRCARDQAAIRVSVKVVSDESKGGRQLRLKRSANWDVLVLVLLDESLCPYHIGIATRSEFDAARSAGAIGPEPFVSRSWVGTKGWMSQYGKVEKISV
jgi:hypothetical protein